MSKPAGRRQGRRARGCAACTHRRQPTGARARKKIIVVATPVTHRGAPRLSCSSLSAAPRWHAEGQSGSCASSRSEKSESKMHSSRQQQPGRARDGAR
jgi:hypothetical protein